VQVLPLNNPLRIAEEAATVDHISAGRFDFGIGRSGFPRAYEIYGVPYAESQGRFREALEIILQAWKGETFTYTGQYYQFANATVSPRPYQLPHPPLRIAANSDSTFTWVGERGYHIFVGLRGMDIPELRVHLQAYRKAWHEAGHPGEGNAYLRIPVYAGVTAQGSIDEPYDSATFYFSRQADITRSALGRPGMSTTEHRLEQAERLSSLSYQQILSTKVAFGTAPALIDRFKELKEELGINGVVAELNAGGLIPLERAQRTLQIMTHEVMPAFK
jgi:alkanesulfonate monooxygenase SsuD/methylene tetrahydromethanopterin reductase-like flavin-dependent oxidoreductase (luciferase family)